MLFGKNKINYRAGFTLVETLIYVAIIGGVAITFVSYSLNISDTRQKTYGAQEVHANARMVMDAITKKIMSASSVNTTSSQFGVDSGVLVLTMASSTLNPTIISLATSTRAVQIKEGNYAATAIISNYVRVDSLVFSNFSASSTRANIGVSVAISAVSSTGPTYQNSQSFRTAVSLRE